MSGSDELRTAYVPEFWASVGGTTMDLFFSAGIWNQEMPALTSTWAGFKSCAISSPALFSAFPKPQCDVSTELLSFE